MSDVPWYENEPVPEPLKPRGEQPREKHWAVCDAATGRVTAVRTRLAPPPLAADYTAREITEADALRYMTAGRPQRVNGEGTMADLVISPAEHRAMRKHAIERAYRAHLSVRYPTDLLALLGHKEELKQYVRKLRKHVQDKKAELDAAGTGEALDAVAWDFAGLDKDDPRLTIDNV